jgi:microcystin-dependent protein
MPKIIGIDRSGYTIGEVVEIGASALPFGTLPCDGSAISRTVYVKLFQKIGTAHGVGDNSTTFNVPDFRGRSSIGDGQGSGLANRVIGQKFGEENHTLTLAEMAYHNHGDSGHGHGVGDPGHNHPIPNYGGGGKGAADGGGRTGASDIATSGRGTGIWIGTGYANIGYAGSNNAHNVMQPSLVVKKAIAYI